MLKDLVNPNVNKYNIDTIKRHYRDAMIKKVCSKQAVSEVVGVILLLGITITLFTVINLNVSQFIFGSSIPVVNLVGTIDKTQNIIYIQHNGGESLKGTTKIIITINSTNYPRNASDLLIDKNSDSTWDLGESLQFNFTGINIVGRYIGFTVIDSNAILISEVLQEGSRS